MKLKNLDLQFYIFAPVDTNGVKDLAVSIEEIELVENGRKNIVAIPGFSNSKNAIFDPLSQNDYLISGRLITGAALCMFLYQCENLGNNHSKDGLLSEIHISGFENSSEWYRSSFHLYEHVTKFDYTSLNLDTNRITMKFEKFKAFDSAYIAIKKKFEYQMPQE